MMQQPAEGPTVFIVDDDEGMRASLSAIIEQVMELPVKCFASADEVLDNSGPLGAGCLLLDARLPGMGGLALHRELTRRGEDLPVFLITGHADQELIEAAHKQGILQVFEKPYQPQDLVQAIRTAIAGA